MSGDFSCGCIPGTQESAAGEVPIVGVSLGDPSHDYSSYPLTNMFDGSESTKWLSACDSSILVDIRFDLGSTKNLDSVYIKEDTVWYMGAFNLLVCTGLGNRGMYSGGHRLKRAIRII